MSMVHKLIDVTSNTADVSSDIIYPQGHDDESGTWQISVTAGTAVKVQFFGRLGVNHAWIEVAVADNTTATAVGDMTIYPQMYVFLDTGASSTSSTTTVSIRE